MNKLKKIIKYTLISLLSIVLLVFVWLVALYLTADMQKPNVEVNLENYVLNKDSLGFECNGNYLVKNEAGLWESYLHGNALDRGIAAGVLEKDLLYYQEKAFVNEIKKIIPSERYLKFLGAFIRIFNRNLGEYIIKEYREEIYGISMSCSSEFDYIGTSYERQLNYHAAHDIGHTMQEYMLVACSSFGVWGSKSSDSTLLIGRNFDFFVGEEFANNKLLSFVFPSTGYKFASVAWAGMIGVLSGINEKGLSVTINASKGSIPTSAATPISILAREILQYASNIDQAYLIAKKRKTFVSESLLIGSAEDGYAVIIEKTPSKIDIYRSNTESSVCTNHYQSSVFSSDKVNLDNFASSDSPYRYMRLTELLENNDKISSKTAVNILRDRDGLGGSKIGLCNEKAINQCIAHHSVVFEPQKMLMWVSTFPWQSGEYVCYDLKKVFSNCKPSGDNVNKELSIVGDSLFLNSDYRNVLSYRSDIKMIKQIIESKGDLSKEQEDMFIASNSNMYYVFDLLGDYYHYKGNGSKALEMWGEALNLEIPTLGQRTDIEKKIKGLKNE